MSRRDPLVALRQMRDHALEAMNLAAGKSRADLGASRILSLAIVRLLEILGEAAGRVPEDVRQAHATIPWSQIIGMRNRLIHGYDQVDLDIVWAVITSDLPALVAKLGQITADGCEPSVQDLPRDIDLDIQFPDLSRIVREVNKVRLSDLAERYPANGFEFYDLERLCAAVQAGRRERNQIGNILDEPGTLLWALKILAVSEKEPARVYLGILNEYVKRGFVEKASQENFVRQKVLCKMKPRAPGCSSECLDTIAECSWALLFAERFERVEEEKPLPGGGNADFCCKRPGKSDLWIDCVSPNPHKDRFAADPTLTLEGWIARQAENKWKSKFGKAHWQQNNSATAVAIALLKTKIRSEEDREASTEMLTIQMLLDRKRTLGELWGAAPDRLWASCPGLEIVWVGELPQSGDALSPNLICEWHRPTP